MDPVFLYLHGFASSPGSKKATVFRREFERAGKDLRVPDLEGGDFRHLTLSRQMDTILGLIDAEPERPFLLIGSSMGGYLAALAAQLRPSVKGIYLMCPGFGFLKRWKLRLAAEYPDVKDFPGLITVFHYRYNKPMELDSTLFEDAAKWESVAFDRELPVRVVHGIHDETVDIAASRSFAATRPWVRLKELDSDHSLLSHIDWIVGDCMGFFREECRVLI